MPDPKKGITGRVIGGNAFCPGRLEYVSMPDPVMPLTESEVELTRERASDDAVLFDAGYVLRLLAALDAQRDALRRAEAALSRAIHGGCVWRSGADLVEAEAVLTAVRAVLGKDGAT